MYSHHPHLPIDTEFGVTEADISGPTHENYAQKYSKRHQQYYDHRFHCMALAPGDIVLVRIKAFGQGHRKADKEEQNPHIVLS